MKIKHKTEIEPWINGDDVKVKVNVEFDALPLITAAIKSCKGYLRLKNGRLKISVSRPDSDAPGALLDFESILKRELEMNDREEWPQITAALQRCEKMIRDFS